MDPEHHHSHFLFFTFPAQGHINPTLQLAKRLMRTGAQISYAISVSAHRRMAKSSLPDGITFIPFSDGYDDGIKPGDDFEHIMSDLKRGGSEALAEIIQKLRHDGRPVTCILYALLLPWVARVALELDTPSALVWIEPATVFDIYYYYFNGYRDVILNNNNDPFFSIELPGLPLPLTCRDLPSFILPSNPDTFTLQPFEEQFEILKTEANPKVLVNTFDALEAEALRAVQDITLIGIGPLVPSAFLDGKDPSDTSFGGDLFQRSNDNYVEWLNKKPESSVVYVSFGSFSELPKRQMEALARGLLDSGRPFLWVVRSRPQETNGTKVKEEEDKLECIEELRREGMIVQWCSQVEVLSHASVGCFVTHCGWNSTLESIVTGVPVVGLPQWADQATNAKLVEDEWKTGVRVKVNEEGIVESDEILRCLQTVMEGERGEEMRRNAKKLRCLAREAAAEGGSSDRKLRDFVDEVSGVSPSNRGKICPSVESTIPASASTSGSGHVA